MGRRFCECPRTEDLGGDNILRTGAPPGVQITLTPCQPSPIQQAAGFYSRNYPELTFGSPYRLPHFNFQLRNESAKMKLIDTPTPRPAHFPSTAESWAGPGNGARSSRRDPYGTELAYSRWGRTVDSQV